MLRNLAKERRAARLIGTRYDAGDREAA